MILCSICWKPAHLCGRLAPEVRRTLRFVECRFERGHECISCGPDFERFLDLLAAAHHDNHGKLVAA